MKSAGVVVILESFEVELATSEEQAILLLAGDIRCIHVYDRSIEEHVGVYLIAGA